MRIRYVFAASAVALGLALTAGTGAASAETATHAGHQASELALTLNAGAKWQGDATMIQGMTRIRGALASRLPAIHDRSLPAGEYKTLASEVQAEVDYMVANCKLTPEVDEQLHMVLGQVLDGIAELQNGPDQRGGAVRIVMALNAYGDHFEHPDWQPLE